MQKILKFTLFTFLILGTSPSLWATDANHGSHRPGDRCVIDLGSLHVQKPSDIPKEVWNELNEYQRGRVWLLSSMILRQKVIITFNGGLTMPSIKGRITGYRLNESPGHGHEVLMLVEGQSTDPNGKSRNAIQSYPLHSVDKVFPIDAPTIIPSSDEVAVSENDLHRYFGSIKKYFEERSQDLIRGALDSMKNGKTLHTTVGVIGAGPHGATALNAVRSAFVKATNTLYEATSHFGTFEKLGRFDTNTVETFDDSGNSFPGSPFQAKLRQSLRRPIC